MFSKLALAGALAIPLGLFALSATARAEDMWNPNSSYNSKYDVPLRPTAPTHPAQAPVTHHATLSCEAAAKIVRKDGFNHVRARECGGRVDEFHAERHGHPLLVDVNPHNGHAWVT